MTIAARQIPDGYSLDDFIAGYDRRNERKFRTLSLGEVRRKITSYEEIDPMLSAVIRAAYVKVHNEIAEIEALAE